MNDAQLREWYAEGLAARAGAGRTTCPKPAELQAVLERRGSEEERLSRLDHVMACPECLREFELLRTIHSASPRPRYGARVLAVAASVALLASATVLWRATSLTTSGVQDTLRGQAVSMLLQPVDGALLDFPATFNWRAIEGARRYRVEFIDEGGEVVLARQTSDTTLALATDSTLVAGDTYRWWVIADLAGGRQVRAVPWRVRFQPK